MGRVELIQEMGRCRLVAVVRSRTAAEAMATARAVAEAGIRFVEITFSVPEALNVIETLSKEAAVHTGAGTVLSAGQAKDAIAAGARFVVSPTLELNLIPICHAAEVACVPGTATPTEILTAARAGADLAKIFPADTLGGAHFIRQMLGPLPEVRFMVSGGVSLENVQDYVTLGVTGICLGSALLGNLLAQKGRDGLVREVRRYVQLVNQALRTNKTGQTEGR